MQPRLKNEFITSNYPPGDIVSILYRTKQMGHVRVSDSMNIDAAPEAIADILYLCVNMWMCPSKVHRESGSITTATESSSFPFSVFCLVAIDVSCGDML